MQKTFTWTKKSRKGNQEWKDVCIIIGLATKMLKIRLNTQVIFQKMLEFQNAISIYYEW